MPPCCRALLACLILSPALLAAAGAPLRVGIDIDGEPMTMVDAKGVPQGFAVEIFAAIAREMNFQVVFVPRHWPDMMADFMAGRTDALANLTYTTERAAFAEFSVPHIVMSGALFERKDGPTMRRLSDLRERRVAVKIGGAPHEYLVRHGWDAHVVSSATLRDSLRAVSEGRADVALDARVVGLKTIRDERLFEIEVADLSVPDFAQRLHIALRLGDAERMRLINEGLARLHANGTYDRIYEKWIDPLDPRGLRWRDLRPYLLPAAIVIAAILSALLWQRRLLRRLARQAEALRSSEERLTLVLEGSDSGFWDWDLRTGRVERSQHWAAMLGYTLEEIEPTFAAGLRWVHADDRPLLEALASRPGASESGRYDLEYRMHTKDGRCRWILDRCKVVARGPDRTPWRIAGTHTDITNLKEAQAELSRQESRFRFIYERAPVGLSWLQQRPRGTRLVNPAHERITGVPAASSMEPTNYVAATHPEDRERQRQLFERLYRGEIDHLSLEKRYVHPDGSVVWAMMSTHLYRDPLSGDANEVTTLVDITELRRAEEEREKLRLKMLDTQKLESLGVLAGGIAHDFNNLLTVILANTSFIRSGFDDPTEREERLAMIDTAARRAADLCRQMLAYAGKGSFLRQRLDLSQLVGETANLLKVSISKKAQLVLDLASRLPAVEADGSQLQQVVMNLVINAAEALDENAGEIRLVTRIARPEPAPARIVHSFDLPAGDCVCLEVLDTGRGMDPATLGRIFDPFFTTKFTGRGLGLAAVLGIVRAMRGALTVESRPGRGTAFRIFLPPATDAAGAAAAPGLEKTVTAGSPPGAAARGRGVILIADDEPVVLNTTSALLRRQGYQTVLAKDGHEAVTAFRGNPAGFFAVLLDLTMPGLDGAEALRSIREINPSVRVLIMSGFSEQDVLARLHGAGNVPILHKPFTVEGLIEALTAAAPIETDGRH